MPRSTGVTLKRHEYDVKDIRDYGLRGVERCRISSKARIERLNKQLPKRVPKAKSGEEGLTKATELILVTSSGIVVIAAMSTSPIHIRPKPVFSAIASPYRASFVPANRMMARHRTNLNQIKGYSSWSLIT